MTRRKLPPEVGEGEAKKGGWGHHPAELIVQDNCFANKTVVRKLGFFHL